MCFSAEVSFGSAAVITIIGVLAYKKANTHPLRLYALIPILFGLQQFFEGLVWLGATYDSFSNYLSFSTYAFIFFAWIIWPIYVPFTLWKLEKNDTRKKILLGFIFVGLFIVTTMIYVTIAYGVSAKIEDCSIKYDTLYQSKYAWILDSLYLLSTTLSHFSSSIKRVWVLGLLNLITFAFAKIYYGEHVISVWCFFAAVSSLIILWIVNAEVKVAAKKMD